MKTRFLTILTTLAFLGFSVSVMAHDCERHKDQTHRHCGGGGGGGGAIVYTAELTGAFVFDVVVTPNSKENQLRSEENLEMVLPADAGLADTWNQVFNTCGELLDPDSVEIFFVGEDNWSIDKTGVEVNGVVVIFHDIRLQEAEVTVQLMGNDFDFISQPFLPEPGQESVFTLDQFAIHGRTMKGVHPRSGCQPHGSGGFDIFPLGDFSTLVITATEQ